MNQAIELLRGATVRFLPILFLFSLAGNGMAQAVQAAPEVVACTGTAFSNDDLDMNWTLGQTATETFFNEGFFLTQGFHQSEDYFLNVRTEKQQQLVITPNNDGLNDWFVLEDVQNYPDNEITILNRWGSTVFKAKPYLNDWRGMTNAGQALPEATYYFIVKLGTPTELLYGSITIKR